MIVPDHGIGSIQDIAGRTVILFQFDHLGIIKYMFKIQDVLNVRTAEFINGLIIVANHAQVTVLGCQRDGSVRTVLYSYPDTRLP